MQSSRPRSLSRGAFGTKKSWSWSWKSLVYITGWQRLFHRRTLKSILVGGNLSRLTASPLTETGACLAAVDGNRRYSISRRLHSRKTRRLKWTCSLIGCRATLRVFHTCFLRRLRQYSYLFLATPQRRANSTSWLLTEALINDFEPSRLTSA